MFQDDPRIVRAAIDYLQRNKTKGDQMFNPGFGPAARLLEDA